MPLEVVGEIFKACLPADITKLDLTNATSLDTIGAPLILSALWANICLRLPPLDNNIQSPLLVLAKNWIERSQECPLSINLCLLNDSQNARELIKLINEYSSRWTYFKYTGDPKFFPHFISDTSNTSQLHTLSLSSPPMWSPTLMIFNDGSVPLRPKCLQLHTVRSLRMVNISWSGLTELRIYSDLPVAMCLEALRIAPNLIRCTLKARDTEGVVLDHFAMPASPLLHANVVELTLITNIYSDIFSHLICPAVEKLAIHTLYEHDIIPMDLLIGFIQRSQCSIFSLSLKGAMLTTAHIDMLINAMPMLCHLDMDLEPDFPTRHFFSLLKEGGSQPQYLSDLQLLTISLRDDRFDFNLLRLVLRDIQNNMSFFRTNLRTLKFVIDKNRMIHGDRNILRHLSSLAQEGMQLDVLDLQTTITMYFRVVILIFPIRPLA
ncbi:hypothetical protein BDN70DRAFT_932489 [Pholiota conissans]|uniref:F-box domain-containing protein n=1 Tax=Pholiota conissans TaxID=109636 RepID=A0A9P5Z4W0_9AGAR|nr:hypothetical protein BDN70DRAFT_932489 [Pholiota conissans]